MSDKPDWDKLLKLGESIEWPKDVPQSVDLSGIPKITPHKQVWHPFNLEKATCKVCGYFHLLDVDDADAPEPLCDDCWQRYAPYFPGFSVDPYVED